VLFLAASLVNGWTALVQPGVYLTFSAIAAGQLAVGICLGVGGRLLRWGVLGGVVFLVAIAPLGFTGSAFPSTVLMAYRLLLLQVRRNTESIPSRKSTRAEGASS
jgi:phosphate/sulfate permease